MKLKLNSVKDLISKALQDEQISELEFKMIVDELDKYNELKDKVRSKQLSAAEEKRN